MILLRTAEPTAPAQTVAIFGVGMVGSALVDALISSGGMAAAFFPVNWDDPEEREQQLTRIEHEIETGRSRPEDRWTFVWSAGRAGFGADAREAALELANFEAVLALARRSAARRAPGSVRIVHFSSAGGLFEGQRQVGSTSIPKPRRPYGQLKQAEEQRVVASGIPYRIARLSSVYGDLGNGRRAGLISILLTNGIRRKVSSIVGTMATLRDFIWAPDVAAFVSGLIRTPLEFGESRTILLASGRPSSIFEIQKIIEDLLGYKIFISYAPRAWNSDDITFSPADLPRGWRPTDLRTSVAAVYRQAIRETSLWRMSGGRA